MDYLNNRSKLALRDSIPKYLNEQQVSEITGLALQTLRNYRFKGIGPSYTKLSRAVRYSLTDVIEFMESRKIIPRGVA